MSSLLPSYEQQFSSLTAEITQKIGTISNNHGAERKSLISEIERQLDEAQELLEQMDLETRELPLTERGKFVGAMKNYQGEFNKLESQIKKAKTSSVKSANQMREDLLGSEHSDADQRTRLLDNTERLEGSTRRLEVGYRIATETEQVGRGILDNLSRDRETISKARGRLREGDANLGKSSRILTSMLRRIVQNRLVTMLIMTFMVVVIIVVIYLAVKKHRS